MFRIQLSILLIISTSICVYAQNTLTYTGETLGEVFKQIESRTDYIFNYDPQLAEVYSYTGQLNLLDLEDAVSDLLYATPLAQDMTDKYITIYQTEPDTFQVCGAVFDAQAQVPLSLANIYLDDYKYSIQPNEDGTFNTYFVGYKNQIVTISYLGYQPVQRMLQEFTSSLCPTNFLQADTDLFSKEIVVTDYLLDGMTEGGDYGSVDFDYQRLTKSIAGLEQDVLKTIQFIPGITSVDESAANLQIRGGTADQNLVLWEGATLYDPGHLFGMISAINPFVIDQVKVNKGVFDPSHDNRVGGVIEMSLPDSTLQSWHGGVGTTLTEAHAYLQAPISQQFSVTLAGRNSLDRFYRTPTLTSYSNKVFQESKVTDEEAEEQADQFLDYYDLNLKGVLQPTENLLIKIGWLQSKNNFNFDADLFSDRLSTSDEVNFSTQANSISAQYSMTKEWQTELNYVHSSYENDYSFIINDNENASVQYQNSVFNRIREDKLAWLHRLSFSPQWQAKVGYDFNRKQVEFELNTSGEFEPNYLETEFVEGRFHNGFLAIDYIYEQLKINVGLRGTYFQEEGAWAFSPRFNLQYALSKQLKIKASAGIFQQYISQLQEFGDNDLGINNQVWVLNNDIEEPEQQAHKVALGTVFRTKGWLLDAEAYYNYNDNIASFSTIFSSNPFNGDHDIGYSVAKGVDILLKKQWSNYQIWLSYALSQVDFNFSEIGEASFPAPNDQRHRLSIVNNWKWQQWNFFLHYQYRTGLSYSNPVGVESFYDEEDEEDYYFIDFNSLHEEKLPSYSRLDFGLRYQTDFQKLNAEFSLSILNVLNRENLFSRDYFLDDPDEEDLEDTPEYFVVDKVMLRRTPQLLVRLFW